MSKVFEALQRQRQNEKEKQPGRDPLAAEAGLPDAETADEVAENFELPSLIGAPTGPRSTEGMIIPSVNGPPVKTAIEDRISGGSQAQTPQKSNGKAQPETSNGDEGAIPESRRVEVARPVVRRSLEQARTQTPTIRWRQSEIPEEQRETAETEPQTESEKATPVKSPREVQVEHLIATRLHPRLILLTDPQAAECEQYRTLRTEVFHAAARKHMQIITVTSALAGEGKTSTVLNLALAIAQSKEKRVLVVDGDLRRPNIASYLGLRPATGLVEALNGETDTFGSLFYLDEHDLYVLPVVRESNNPTELLSSERLSEMIAQLREYFDFVLVDSPPIMPFADSRLLANHADAVILVVRAGMAPYETVEKAIAALPQNRILGVVLNGAEHLKDSDYYNYYYNYARREQRKRTISGRIAKIFRGRWGGGR
jgi:capsular exopolysaccharide synthesis family protein